MSCNCGCRKHHHDHEHGCGHDHEHGSLKRDFVIIIVSAVLLAAAASLPLTGWLRLASFLLPYLVVGNRVLLSAGKNILKGHAFDEAFLMALATLGAFGIGEYPEAVMVMLFFQLGELFEHLAEKRSRKSITELMDLRPDHANVERDGQMIRVDPKAVRVGDVILVKPGEKVPLDGVILSGSTALDTAALTGESLPRDAGEGDSVLSGCVNLTGAVRVTVTKEYGESTVSKILEMVENAMGGKTRSETFIRRFAKWYTPVVVVGAVLLAVIPSLVMGDWGVWLRRALTFLVISCPCALVVSVPLSFFGGIGAASKMGVLVKGSNYLEALADAKVVVFDKTGTLTRGKFRVTEIVGGDAVLEYAALAECCSDHPVAASLKEAYGRDIDVTRISETQELAGHGVRAVVDGKTVLVGSRKLMEENQIAAPVCQSAGTAVYVALGGEYLGSIVIADILKDDAAKAVASLKAVGVEKTVMLTGDRASAAMEAAENLGIDEVMAELLPQDKVDAVHLLKSRLKKREKLIFVGDGINDAPVLAGADVGVAMGAFGSDAAMEAADVVLMDDQPSKLVPAMAIARKTRFIVTENIAFSIGVKVLFLVLGAAGIVGLGGAIFADVGVLVLAVTNAARALRPIKEKRE